jgi:hypothetical protein
MCDINVVSVSLGQGTAEENSVLVSVHPHIRLRFTPGFRWMLLYRWSKESTVEAKISGCSGMSDNRFQPPGKRHTSTVVYVSGVNVTPIKMWACITLWEILEPGFVCIYVCIQNAACLTLYLRYTCLIFVFWWCDIECWLHGMISCTQLLCAFHKILFGWPNRDGWDEWESADLKLLAGDRNNGKPFWRGNERSDFMKHCGSRGVFV